mmetsp:Transcript_69497/g.155633  ORF Transcript_69497/g.155633 Transcript_69497/m.155633 type:complete len:96 (+) Transcript_69497:82-369(+)
MSCAVKNAGRGSSSMKQCPSAASCDPGTVFQLACLLENRGKFQEAEQLMRRELAGCEALNGPTHEHTLGSLRSLARVLRAAGRPEEAAVLELRLP